MIQQLRGIVNNFSAEEIDGYLVDVQTANAIVTVYDALKEENKEKFINCSIDKMASIAWKLVS